MDESRMKALMSVNVPAHIQAGAKRRKRAVNCWLFHRWCEAPTSLPMWRRGVIRRQVCARCGMIRVKKWWHTGGWFCKANDESENRL